MLIKLSELCTRKTWILEAVHGALRRTPVLCRNCDHIMIDITEYCEEGPSAYTVCELTEETPVRDYCPEVMK